MNKKVCQEDKVLNPKTNRCVKIDGTVAKKFLPKQKKICRSSKVLNPKTNRCVKINGVVAKKLKLKKSSSPLLRKSNLSNPNYRTQPKRSSSSLSSSSHTRKSLSSHTPAHTPTPISVIEPKKSSRSSMSASRKKRLDAFIEKVAAKKIQKLTMPFIKRVSIDIDDRIRTYKIYTKYFAQYNKNQCLKIVKKGNNVEYSIADDNIKIVKRIGTESQYGAIYLSKGSNVGELFRFASKIMVQDKSNTIEIKILMQVSKLVINKINPHFPIMYNTFFCNIHEKNRDLPKFANNQDYYINFNELANGDLKMFMLKEYNNYKLVNNAMAQVFIAILSFHSLGYSHNDAHWGNFLYHKINPGGYIKYNINGYEVFIENLGYLWIIWDYGFTKLFDKLDILTTMTDYVRIIKAFGSGLQLNHGFLPFKTPTTDNTIKLAHTIIDKYYEMIYDEQEISNFNSSKKSIDSIFFEKLIFETSLFIERIDLPTNAKIINATSYVIIA
jgi:hypothetical protein